jgi:hypothetical protein
MSRITHSPGLRHLVALALVGAAAAALTGCTASDASPTTARSQTPTPAASPATPTATPAPPTGSPEPPADTTGGQPPATTTGGQKPASASERTAAVAAVAKRGYDVKRATEYVPGRRINVLTGIFHGSATDFRQKAFFFINGRLIGTDTSEESSIVNLVGVQGDVATLKYALYDKTSGQCCPRTSTTVRYRWTGAKLVPLDKIPPTYLEAQSSHQASWR